MNGMFGFTEQDTVTRVTDPSDGIATGSHIEPPLEENWPAVDKLRWHAAAVRADTGLKLRIHVITSTGQTKYAITGHGYGGSHLSYHEAWRYITDLGIGADMHQILMTERENE